MIYRSDILIQKWYDRVSNVTFSISAMSYAMKTGIRYHFSRMLCLYVIKYFFFFVVT